MVCLPTFPALRQCPSLRLGQSERLWARPSSLYLKLQTWVSNVEAAHATATCPILKQMMRHTTSNMGLCGPSPEDTPIHPWMVKHGIEPLPYGASWATSLNASLSPADARRGGARLGGALEGDTGHSTESRPGQPLVELDSVGCSRPV